MDPSIHLIERQERRGRRLPALAMLGVIAILGATWAGLFNFLGTNAAFGTVTDLEDTYLCDAESMALDFPDLSRLSEVFTADGVLLGKLTERNSQPTPIDEMPELVKAAIVSAEDGDFYDHEGIDFSAIARAAIQNAREGNLQGGSTITQQIVKKNFLTDDRTLERKVCEAVIAAELETRYTKDQILEFYMNSQFFGENAYGVKAAAQEYFGKDLNALTIAEAALMMVPIRNPTAYDLRESRRAATVKSLRNQVIEQMYNNEYITRGQADAAIAQDVSVIEHQDFEQLAPQVIIAAREEVLGDPKYGLGETYSERKQALFGCPASDADCEGGGGLTVTVTVDWEMQEKAREILKAWFQDPTGPTGAIAMVDNRTGAVKVMASGLDFGDDIEAGQRPYDLATKGRRQAGSSFKPFTLIAALESGSQYGWPITLGTYWDYSSPQKIDCGYPCYKGGNIWTVSNAGGSNSGGIRTLEEATYLSTNTVYAQVSLAVGPEKVVDVAHRMGIESPLNPFLSIALGTEPVSPLEMAAAYSTIANFGLKVDNYIIESIEDDAGNVVYQHEVETERVLDEALTASVVSAMEKVVSQGTAQGSANIGRPQAGKTGTAQNFRDVWFMGFIPQYSTAVWVGHADAQIEMEDFTVFNALTGKDQYYRRAYGGSLAAPIWKQFMLYVTEDLPIEDFPPEPDGTSAYRVTPTVEVPSLLNLAEGDMKTAAFQSGLRITISEVASLEPEGTFLGQRPSAGSKVKQGSTIVVEISNGIPPTLPDLTGVPIGEVNELLVEWETASGIDISWRAVEVPSTDPTTWGKVVGTDPGPNGLVEDGDVISVFVGVAAPAPPGGGDGNN
jgi:membrane peptidoglycan carboxypeptidase